MPSRQIGETTFLLMAGTLQPPAQEVEELTRPGEDYASWRLQGKRGRESLLKTWATADTAAAAATARDAYAALIGTSVTILDAHGNSHANCRILDAVTEIRVILYGGAAKWLLTTDWKVKQAPAA